MQSAKRAVEETTNEAAATAAAATATASSSEAQPSLQERVERAKRLLAEKQAKKVEQEAEVNFAFTFSSGIVA